MCTQPEIAERIADMKQDIYLIEKLKHQRDGLLDVCKNILNAGMCSYSKWIGKTDVESELISAIKIWQEKIEQAIANTEK